MQFEKHACRHQLCFLGRKHFAFCDFHVPLELEKMEAFSNGGRRAANITDQAS